MNDKQIEPGHDTRSGTRNPELTGAELVARVPGWISGTVRILILLVVVIVFMASLLPLAADRAQQDGHPLWLLLWLAGLVGVFMLWLRGWIRGRDPHRPRSVAWIVVLAAIMAVVMGGLVWSSWRQGGFAGLIANAEGLVAGFSILGMMLGAIALLRSN
ncbi:hypothetical protein E2F46_14765 [Luteimonas aestuarii]|uniref:Transmembrane protein n=1 Tax=Luteimonas aestuarii TaxID=453837 RepID=A0A4R5TSX1_9GAMM|nr:hypothetical protein [Luteimonas aestuarii]TDK21495.1 hypothetical protein E2F46_14765 [Luteimonas aestuarii]